MTDLNLNDIHFLIIELKYTHLFSLGNSASLGANHLSLIVKLFTNNTQGKAVKDKIYFYLHWSLG